MRKKQRCARNGRFEKVICSSFLQAEEKNLLHSVFMTLRARAPVTKSNKPLWQCKSRKIARHCDQLAMMLSSIQKSDRILN